MQVQIGQTLQTDQHPHKDEAVRCQGDQWHLEDNRALTCHQEWEATTKVDRKWTALLKNLTSNLNFQGQGATKVLEVWILEVQLGIDHSMQGRLTKLCPEKTLRTTCLEQAKEVKKNSGYPRTNKAKAPLVKLDRELTLPTESNNASSRSKKNSSRKNSTQKESDRCWRRMRLQARAVRQTYGNQTLYRWTNKQAILLEPQLLTHWTAKLNWDQLAEWPKTLYWTN